MKIYTSLVELEKAGGHRFKRDRFGEIDDMAWDYEFHNGPECEVCGWCPCVHCALHTDGFNVPQCVSPTADGGGI